ncbi:MAG: cytochrome P450 [Alphaproteobacteria bacterium]|nr:cytochrome P450 [Alphaproteobacteria bacterium]
MAEKHINHELSPMECPHKLEDVDLFGPGAQEHWYDAYPILHEHAPVLRIPGEGYAPGTDGYILSKYEDISMVVKDPVRFPATLSFALEDYSDDEIQGTEEKPPLNAMQISIRSLRPNVELWRAHRQELTDPWVGPGASRHKDMITEMADRLIANWIDRSKDGQMGEVEFVNEFARPLPQMVMANVLGFPLEDLDKLERWGSAQVKQFVYGRGHRNELTRDEINEQFKELAGFDAYVRNMVKEKRANPQDDMISFLCDVTYKALDRKLTDEEVVGVVYAMVIGGLETTQYAIAEQAQLLIENPGLWEAIKEDRSKIRPFTEEAMRVRAPTQGLSTRITSQDEEFQGVKVPKGSLLHMRWAAGNLDPDEYECPYEVKLDRKPVSKHLTFSQGPRTCPGNGISRVEQQIAWERLLDNLEKIEYAPGNKFLHQPGIMLGTLELKLKFQRA